MEIELKLSLSLAAARRLQAHPLLASAQPQKYRLFNTYYDTPARDLYRRGIALRLRRKGWAVWLMTVKGADPAAGALAQRSEWEAPTQPGVLDFSIVTDQGLREFLEARQAALQPLFSTDFTRTAWHIRRSDALVELALDRGKISALKPLQAPPPEAICELELELIEGESPDALFELAIELATDLHLHPAIASKAERGYALLDGTKTAAFRAIVSPLSAAMTPVEAFRATALTCLLQLQRNEAGVLAGEPDCVHQARVAMRRLRSAFNLFAPALAPEFIATYAPRWRELAGQLGSARDWDVFLAETLTPLELAFPDHPVLNDWRTQGEAQQLKGRLAARSALAGQGFSQLLLAFAAALYRVVPPTIAADGPHEAELRRFAVQRLRRRTRKIAALARTHGGMNEEQRHELRIAFKKLRYALEFFVPLLPRKGRSSYFASLAKIQELLGLLNDLVTAAQRITTLPRNKDMPPLINGWFAGRAHLLTQLFEEELQYFLSLPTPWRREGRAGKGEKP